MSWLLDVKEMREKIGHKTPEEQVEILDATMKETDKIIKHISSNQKNKKRGKK